MERRLLLVFALFFDTLDGRVARLTKTQSAFGLQIDSLAGIVHFWAPSRQVDSRGVMRRPEIGRNRVVA